MSTKDAAMLDVDLDQFWKDDELAHKDNCFSPDAPQVALGIRMSEECVFAELGEEGNPWGHTPRERRLELNKRYNDKAERIVGRRLLLKPFRNRMRNSRMSKGSAKSLKENIYTTAFLNGLKALSIRHPSWKSCLTE